MSVCEWSALKIKMESADSAVIVFFFVVAKCVKLREESKLGIGLNIMAKHLKTLVKGRSVYTPFYLASLSLTVSQAHILNT